MDSHVHEAMTCQYELPYRWHAKDQVIHTLTVEPQKAHAIPRRDHAGLLHDSEKTS